MSFVERVFSTHIFINFLYCATTGAQILDRLSFGGKTVSDGIFGLMMCIIGFLVVGVFVLHQNQLR